MPSSARGVREGRYPDRKTPFMFGMDRTQGLGSSSIGQ